ncbi:MAG: beta-galactosidase [Labilithrix sp.]|nr:beta-galactosidase [Labilithrix sp.]
MTSASRQPPSEHAQRRPRGSDAPPPRTVEVHPHGLMLLGRDGGGQGEVLPLWAGAMHYWRHAPEHWGPCLDAMKAMGLRVVDTYIPWGVHEVAQGTFDFGESFARLDVARFLRLCDERGLYVVARPGPHINAELTYFGLPERVVWDRECQARTPRDNPVILPIVPTAFPVPSYASDAFHDEAALWFEAVGRVLAPLQYPNGPIVMWQIDNEGALYFRDGPYDQDYHPDAVRLFRSFLREKYSSAKALRDAWNEANLTFAVAAPPQRFDARTADELPRHMDWMEFHEHLLVEAMARFAKALENAGCASVPTMHNLPLGEAATALNPGRIARVVDLVGLDYYHPANPKHHMAILRRTGELAVRCEGVRVPAYGAEVGAGFPPFFAPLDDQDSLYTLIAALAYGLRGFNLYMAVDRDRWVGAPIDEHGLPRRLADAYHALIEALDRVKLNTLHRRAPVRLVVPRALRRLSRATHAFGPVTPALFNVTGAGPLESCLEDDLGLGGESEDAGAGAGAGAGEGEGEGADAGEGASDGDGHGARPFAPAAPIAGESFVRAFERALLARGVPFAYAGGEALAESIEGASWIVCTTAGGLKRDVLDTLRDAQARGVAVTIGPSVPRRDGSMRALERPHDVRGLEVEPLDDPARADALVARLVEKLELPTFPCDPPTVYVTIHDDDEGTPRVAFVMNPEPEAVLATVGLGPRVRALVDLLPHTREPGRIEASAGGFVVEVPARTARIFAVEV